MTRRFMSLDVMFAHMEQQGRCSYRCTLGKSGENVGKFSQNDYFYSNWLMRKFGWWENLLEKMTKFSPNFFQCRCVGALWSDDSDFATRMIMANTKNKRFFQYFQFIILKIALYIIKFWKLNVLVILWVACSVWGFLWHGGSGRNTGNW